MANERLTDKTELTSVANTDILYVVDDPAGSPISKKATVDSVAAAFDHGCFIYEVGGAQTITTSTFTAVTFDTERKDTDAYHDTGSNTSRITIPSGQAGTYFIEGCVTWNAAFAAAKICRIYLNGTGGTILAGVRDIQSDGITQNPSTVWDLSVTDYVELVVFHTQGGDQPLNMATEGTAHFRVQRLA